MSFKKIASVTFVGMTLLAVMGSSQANAQRGYYPYGGYYYPYPYPTCYSCGIIIGPQNPLRAGNNNGGGTNGNATLSSPSDSKWCDAKATGWYACGNGYSCGYVGGDTNKGCVWFK